MFMRLNVRNRRKMDEVIEALADNKYHTVDDLVQRTRIPKGNMGAFLKFLSDFGFARFCGGYAVRVKLNPRVGEFLKKIKWIENSEEQG